MVEIKTSDIMPACAEILIDRLYELVLCDNKIMVCDWLAYATLAAYRIANNLTGEGVIPTMEECFNGSAVPQELSCNPKWRILQSMHRYHWKRANTTDGEQEYETYFSIVAINLDGIMLCQ
ncbi:MAG: hypothetical protein NC453_10605 [Muribaculum sp.]|nr:hypothetical protein [Muribaculum sp.]